MPNICTNCLIIRSSNKQDIIDFSTRFIIEVKSWNYDDNLVKSIINETVKDENIEWKLVIDFDSPWQPPRKYVEELCDIFPDMEVSLIYYEIGINFYGEMHHKRLDYHRENQRRMKDEDFSYHKEDGTICVTEEDEMEEYFVRSAGEFDAFLKCYGMASYEAYR